MDIKNKKSCHSGYANSFAGWFAPLHALKEAHQVHNAAELLEYFSGGCAPGAPAQSKLCTQCVGNRAVAAANEQIIQATKCKPTEAEEYNGNLGALK